MIADAQLFAEVYAVATDLFWRIDQCDVDGAMHHIAEGASITVSGTTATGCTAIRSAMTAAVATQGTTRHILTNLRVIEADDSQLRTQSVVLVTVVQGERRAVTTLDYSDSFARRGDGRLLLSRRVIELVSKIESAA